MAHHIEPPKFDGSKVFFTSDTHFYHDNIIRYCQRLFKDAAHMYDVGVDNNDFRPVSFAKVKSIIEKQIERERSNGWPDAWCWSKNI